MRAPLKAGDVLLKRSFNSASPVLAWNPALCTFSRRTGVGWPPRIPKTTLRWSATLQWAAHLPPCTQMHQRNLWAYQTGLVLGQLHKESLSLEPYAKIICSVSGSVSHSTPLGSANSLRHSKTNKTLINYNYKKIRCSFVSSSQWDALREIVSRSAHRVALHITGRFIDDGI